MVKIREQQRGSILLYTLMILGALIIVTASLLKMFIPKLHIVKESAYSKMALYAADSGMEWCINNVRKSNSDTIIKDNTDSTGITITGAWPTSVYNTPFYGTDYLHDNNDSAGKGIKSVRYTPTIITAGDYEVSAWWTVNTNRATNAPFVVNHSAGTSTYYENQTISGGQWVVLGTHHFNAGSTGYVQINTNGTYIDATHGYVIADAVRFRQITNAPPQPTLSNGATYQIYFGNGGASCIAAEDPFNHRTVGTYRGISRSLEVF